jgi:hypothetical protein
VNGSSRIQRLKSGLKTGIESCGVAESVLPPFDFTFPNTSSRGRQDNSYVYVKSDVV